MLTTNLLSAVGPAAHLRERSPAAQSGDGSFGRILAAEVGGGAKPSPAPKVGTGVELLRNETGKVSDMIQSWMALVGTDGSDSTNPESPPLAGNPELSNPGEAEDYWTPERMQTALPLMPSPTRNSGGDVAILPVPDDGLQISELGAPPPSEQTV